MIPDPLAGVEVVEPPVDTIELPVEPEEVIVPPLRRRAWRWRIRYPHRWLVRAPYCRPLPEAPTHLQRHQSDRLTATPRVYYGDMMW